VVGAVDAVLAPSRPKRAFVMARPPGHHAQADIADGFCIFNNVMIGVAHAEYVYGLKRIAILDFDVHHGNGGEALTFGHASRLYASTHESPLFPGTGLSAGRFGEYGEVINVPLREVSSPAEFKAAWKHKILPQVVKYEPELVFISAGFDAHADDPLGSLGLQDEDFEWLTAAILKAVDPVPVVSVLEGGYDLSALVRSTEAHLKALIET
jgi:acetoin utilization deacetylase AcuC-like enzyme